MIGQNEGASFTQFKMFVPKSCKRKFLDCNFQEPTEICHVQVVNNHILDVAESMTTKGIEHYMQTLQQIPCVLNVVSREFDGNNLSTNHECRDELINLRTNFCRTLVQNMYPLTDHDCVFQKE